MIEGAPGHGEGHNSGMPLNIIAALAVKKGHGARAPEGHHPAVAGRGRRGGRGPRRTIVKAGMFKDVDICLFTHVAANFGVS